MSECLSADQLYKILHISKRKLKYLLDNGYIPCEIRSSRTWRYRIDKETVEQVQKSLEANQNCFGLPSGLFNSGGSKVQKNSRLCLNPAYLAAFRSWLTEKYRTYPGALTLTQAAKLSYLSPNCILLRIKKKEIFASLIGTHYVISKRSIIEYISSDRMLRSSAANNQCRVLIEKYYGTASNFKYPFNPYTGVKSLAFQAKPLGQPIP